MNANTEIVFKDLSFKIVGLAMEVHNELGGGFLEKVYENALMVQFKNNHIPAEQQKAIPVKFKNETVGEYFADIVVDNKIILELKVVDQVIDIHRAQAVHYLKATGFELAILINFGKRKLTYERFVNQHSRHSRHS